MFLFSRSKLSADGFEGRGYLIHILMILAISFKLAPEEVFVKSKIIDLSIFYQEIQWHGAFDPDQLTQLK